MNVKNAPGEPKNVFRPGHKDPSGTVPQNQVIKVKNGRKAKLYEPDFKPQGH